MKIIRILAVVVFLFSAAASINAEIAIAAPMSIVQQLPPPPPRPPLPRLGGHRAPARPVYHRRVHRRRPLIRLPHIKLPPHPRRPPPLF